MRDDESAGPFEVIVTREGDAWLADVSTLQGAHTFASSLDELRAYVREAIVLAADLPDDAQPVFELRIVDAAG